MTSRIILFYLSLLFYIPIFAGNVEGDTISAMEKFKEAENCMHGTNGAFLNKEKAFDSYKQAAEMNYVPAIVKIANFYHDGIVVEKDLSKYLSWLLKAAQLEDPDAQNRVGVCYHDGIGTDQNIEKAQNWYIKAAKQGNLYAMNNLRILYSNQGKTKESLAWARRGAELGQIECQYALGKAYNNGDGLKKDKEQAFYWFKKAADSNHNGACNEVGVLLHNEEENYNLAFEYFSKAVKLGSKNATYNLAMMYELGRGVEKDEKKAVELYQKSIEDNAKNALNSKFHLGVLFYEGRESIKKDKKKGKALLEEAAEEGYEPARKYLNEHKIKWTFTVNGEEIFNKKKK